MHPVSGSVDGAKARASGESVGTLNTAPLPDIVCHVCGAKNAATTKVCKQCGSPLNRRDAQSNAGAPAPLPSPQKGGVAIWWFVGAALILFVIIGAFAWFSSRTESYTAVAKKARWVRTITVAATRARTA